MRKHLLVLIITGSNASESRSDGQIKNGAPSKAYDEGWSRIFGEKKNESVLN